jgi:hypothetical protein
MTWFRRSLAFTLASLVLVLPISAQQAARDAMVTVITTAPVFVLPDATRTPLQLAKEGSVLKLLDIQGDWYHVQFNDPQLGLRVGYVQTKHAKLQIPEYALQPSDLSVKITPPTSPRGTDQLPRVSKASTARALERPTLFITPTTDGFEVYLSAAMQKKQVPVTVVTTEQSATLVLKASAVDVQQQSTGAKFARCLFAYCAGIEDRGVTSVQLQDGETIAWSYSVNKGRGQKNRQSLAEAIAKHLKDDYFDMK